MECKIGFYSCAFIGQADMCNICNDGDNYEPGEEILMNNNTHGGKRPNQTGRPKVKPYKTISFRADIEDIEQAKTKHGKGLNKLFKEWLKGL